IVLHVGAGRQKADAVRDLGRGLELGGAVALSSPAKIMRLERKSLLFPTFAEAKIDKGLQRLGIFLRFDPFVGQIRPDVAPGTIKRIQSETDDRSPGKSRDPLAGVEHLLLIALGNDLLTLLALIADA